MSYTPQQEARLRALYSEAETDEARREVVEALSAEFRVSKHSIVGKLSSMGIYKRPSRTNKAGEPIVSKLEYVKAIRIMLGALDHELDTLEKASKRDLQIVMERLIALSEAKNLS